MISVALTFLFFVPDKFFSKNYKRSDLTRKWQTELNEQQEEEQFSNSFYKRN